MKSQSDEILDFLKTGEAIGANEALRRFGCGRLAARILDLRDSGWNIDTTMIKSKSARTGRTVRFAIYSLPKGKRG